MKLLLDSHTFLWFLEGNNNLSKTARLAIENPDNKSFVSIASIWELVIKKNLGKLKLDIEVNILKAEILKNRIDILPLDLEHFEELYKLEWIHRDPFDRIIILQAISENFILISKDSNFGLYKDLNLLW